jgi:hypothetical protein
MFVTAIPNWTIGEIILLGQSEELQIVAIETEIDDELVDAGINASFTVEPVCRGSSSRPSFLRVRPLAWRLPVAHLRWCHHAFPTLNLPGRSVYGSPARSGPTVLRLRGSSLSAKSSPSPSFFTTV